MVWLKQRVQICPVQPTVAKHVFWSSPVQSYASAPTLPSASGRGPLPHAAAKTPSATQARTRTLGETFMALSASKGHTTTEPGRCLVRQDQGRP